MCLKNDIFVSECSEDMCFVKNGSSMYLGDDGAKELVQGRGETHVTLIQEMYSQWEVLWYYCASRVF